MNVNGTLSSVSRERLESRDDEPSRTDARPTVSRPIDEPDWSTVGGDWHAPLALPPAATRTPAPPPAPAQNPPPLPNLPSAPNALHGVTLAWLTKDLPKAERSELSPPLTAGDYRLHAQMQKQPDGAQAVAYFTAYNVRTKRVEFVVGPDALATFTAKPDLYVDAAARSAAQGVPTRPYEIESQRVTQEMMEHGFGAGFRALGTAWSEAVRDPEWWIRTTTNVVCAVGPALAARAGGATAALAAEATPEVSEATQAASAAAARRVLGAARAQEPQITRVVRATSEAHGAKMVGLEARLKTEGSLSRKIATDAGDVAKVDTAAAGVKDAVRYTASLDASAYGDGYRGIVKELKAQGYELRSMKNTWESSGYKGVNASFRGPEGQVFELQFHTPESFAAKSEAHELYEQWRAPGTSAARRVALEQEMSVRFKMVPIPKGAYDVRVLERLAAQGIGIIVAATRKDDR